MQSLVLNIAIKAILRTSLRSSFLNQKIKHFSTSLEMHQAPKAKLMRPEPSNISINTPRDPCTLSNYNNFHTKHTAVTVNVDFEKHKLTGEVCHTFESITDGESEEVVLDSRYICFEI